MNKRKASLGRHDRRELRSAVNSSEAVTEEKSAGEYGAWGNGQWEPEEHELHEVLSGDRSYSARKEPCQ